MEEITFTLPLPPSINTAYADVIKRDAEGKQYVKRIGTSALQEFKADVRYILFDQGIHQDSWKDIEQIGYDATFYFRSKASDLDNRIKPLQDSLSDFLGFNDNRIYAFHPYKRIDAETPRVEVRLFVIKER